MDDDIREVAQKIVYPGFYKKLGSVFAALAIVALLREGFDLGLAAPLVAILNVYEQLTGAVFDPIATLIKSLGNWLGFKIELFSHWKHVFLLMSLYFFAGVRVEILSGKQWVGIVVRVVLGFCLALATSVLLGVNPLTTTDSLANFFAAAIPALATFLNDLALRGWRVCFQYSRISGWFNRVPPSRFEYFMQGARGILLRTIVCLAVIIVGLYLSSVIRFGSPGLVLLGFVILVHALNLIFLGVREIEWRRQEGDTVTAAFLRSRATLIGLQMFSVVFDTFLFVAVSAGLTFVTNSTA